MWAHSSEAGHGQRIKPACLQSASHLLCCKTCADPLSTLENKFCYVLQTSILSQKRYEEATSSVKEVRAGVLREVTDTGGEFYPACFQRHRSMKRVDGPSIRDARHRVSWVPRCCRNGYYSEAAENTGEIIRHQCQASAHLLNNLCPVWILLPRLSNTDGRQHHSSE